MEKSNEISKQILIGSILGDGYLIKNGDNCYFEESHSLKQKEYLNWKGNYIPDSKLSLRVYNNYKLGKKYGAVRLRTPNNPYFTKLRAAFYPIGKKIVPKEFLNQLGELGLTVWYLDDGHVNVLANLIDISTDGYSLEENYLIKTFLKKKWGADPNVSKRKNKYYLTFDRKSSDKLLGIFDKVFDKYSIPNSMRYKLGALWVGNKEILEKERIKKNKYKNEWRAKKRAVKLIWKEKIEKEKINKIKELYYEKEKSLYEVAKSLGYKSHVAVLKIMKKHNLKRRTISQACTGEKNGFFGKKHSQKTKKLISKVRKKVVE